MKLFEMCVPHFLHADCEWRVLRAGQDMLVTTCFSEHSYDSHRYFALWAQWNLYRRCIFNILKRTHRKCLHFQKLKLNKTC